MAVTVDIKNLFEAGVHFGHKTSRWHPKMAPYIHSKRQDSHIIDLTRTVEALEKALPFITETVAKGKSILFVGTKKQAKDVVKNAAVATGQPYVAERWIGGTLTNVATIGSQIKHLKLLEKRLDSGELTNRYNKLEIQRFQEEVDNLNLKYGGVKDLSGQPGAVFVTDIITEANAVREAKKLGIPVIGLVDTNANPGDIDYAVPSNDDAIKAVSLMVDYVVAAVNEGLAKRKTDAPKEG
jgi:small subunit ribosomal protein S2